MIIPTPSAETLPNGYAEPPKGLRIVLMEVRWKGVEGRIGGMRGRKEWSVGGAE